MTVWKRLARIEQQLILLRALVQALRDDLIGDRPRPLEDPQPMEDHHAHH